MDKIGIVAALDREVAMFKGGLSCPSHITVGSHRITRGFFGQKDVAIIISGVGRRGVRRAAKALIESFRPDLIISTGYAGGLSPEIEAGDIVVTGEVIHESGRRVFSKSIDNFSASPPIRRGPILTTNRFIPFSHDKKGLYRKFGARAVDMESFFLGEEASNSKTPFLSVRVVSDDVNRDLPQLSNITGRDGRPKTAKIARYFLTHPKMILPSIGILRDINKATRLLNLYLEDFVSSL